MNHHVMRELRQPGESLRCVNDHPTNSPEVLLNIIAQAIECRRYQVSMYEPEKLEDGTDLAFWPIAEKEIRQLGNRRPTWRSQVRVHSWRVFREVEPAALRRCLIALIAVLVGWVADIDSRSTDREPRRPRLKEKVGVA